MIFDIQSVAIYLTLLVLIVLLSMKVNQTMSKSNKKNKKFNIYLFLIPTILSLVSGLRSYSVGIDTKQYVNYFYDIVYDGGCFNPEIGFKYLILMCSKIYLSPTSMFLTCAIITNFLIVYRLWDFRDFSSFPVMIVCYYILFFPFTMNIMRQFISIAIIFWGTRYLLKQKYFTYILLVLLSVLFHKSSIIGFLFLFLEIFRWNVLNKKSRLFINIIYIFTPIIIIFSFFILEKYWHYLANISLDLGFMVPIKLFVFILLFKSIDRLFEKEKYKNSYINIKTINIYYLVSIITYFISYFYKYVERIILPFAMFECVFIGESIKYTKFRVLFSAFYFFILAVGLYEILFQNGQGINYYRFVWQ